MLLPALNKARRAAKSVQCMSNLRQLALGCHMYANENRGYLPWAVGPGSGNSYYVSSRYWFSALADHYISRAVFVCPADESANDWATTLGQYGTSRVDDFPISYGYSEVLGNTYRQTLMLQLGTPAGNQEATELSAKQLSSFNGRSGARSVPTTAILLFDYANIPYVSAGPFPTNTKVTGDFTFGVSRLSARHGNGKDTINLANGQSIPTTGIGNFAFIDGHVEGIAAPFSVSQFSPNLAFSRRYEFAGHF
jgi:prepilin-type processing-associated H-X9-DG protein